MPDGPEVRPEWAADDGFGFDDSYFFMGDPSSLDCLITQFISFCICLWGGSPVLSMKKTYFSFRLTNIETQCDPSL